MKWIIIVPLTVFVIYILIKAFGKKCESCGHRWFTRDSWKHKKGEFFNPLDNPNEAYPRMDQRMLCLSCRKKLGMSSRPQLI